ncbi:MAG: hypothetical protein AB7T49_19480 [Oligoflexales bacterium]
MLKKIFVLASVLASTSSFASFYEVCNFVTTVESVQRLAKVNGTVNESAPLVAVFKIVSSEEVAGHTDCSGHEGETRVLSLENERLEVGQTVKLRYSYIDGLGPDGTVSSSTSYSIIE